MIKLIQEKDYASNTYLLDQMFQIRASVFKGRLDWDVTVVNDREIDIFDEQAPLYLISTDEHDQVLGSVRLLPTTGPNMLRDVFSCLTPDGVIASPLIWESSRFCINPALTASNHANLAGYVNKITVELLCGLVEVGMKAGLDYVVSVYDSRMARIFRSINCIAKPVGVSQRIGKTMTHAGLFEINDALWKKMAQSAGITNRVLDQNTPFTIAA